MKNWSRVLFNWFGDLVIFFGLSLVIYGVSLVYIPAGFIVGGVFLVGTALIIIKDHQ